MDKLPLLGKEDIHEKNLTIMLKIMEDKLIITIIDYMVIEVVMNRHQSNIVYKYAVVAHRVIANQMKK